LKEQYVVQIHGLHVPQLLDFDDESLMIGMTIVSRPYLFDFAGTYLDEPPDFPDYVLGNGRRTNAKSRLTSGRRKIGA
jgi:hypothetical protein